MHPLLLLLLLVGVQPSPVSQFPLEHGRPCTSADSVFIKTDNQEGFLLPEDKPLRFDMYVHSAENDRLVSAQVLGSLGGYLWETLLRSHMYRVIRGVPPFKRPKDPLFLDLGANIGSHALFFAALGVRTHAFEPLPSHLAVLLCSQAANPIMQKTLRINGFGLSNTRSESGCMSVADNNLGDAVMETSSNNRCLKTAEGIRLRRLDDYWKEVLHEEHVFALKIDIQGFEQLAFEGAREMLARKPPLFIFMEYSPYRYRQLGQDPVKFLEDLIRLGYKITESEGDGTHKIRIGDGSIEALIERVVEVDLELVHEERYAKYVTGKIQY
eukprot:m.552055 g.552055  ORF g.552055 m.552055 type:complete len:326 (+) comp57737_c2_seq13:1144-2121(+)